MKTQMAPSLLSDYEAKRDGYFEHTRPEMHPFIPVTCRRLLDVGCGRGSFAAGVKAKFGCETWGVEPEPKAAGLAAERLDHALEGCFGPETELPSNYFDCIVFNDVLEHMVDPAAALRYARNLLTREGVLVASIPNIAHFQVVWSLVMEGNWDYKDEGTLDRTHLRFFTRRSIIKMFEAEKYQVARIEGINGRNPRASILWTVYRLIALWPKSSIREMRYLQFATVARPLAES
jgi:2-polyprenyl-3-methyl-5-hydroxy-6-metoxy-1,4-benzoquinol methylase